MAIPEQVRIAAERAAELWNQTNNPGAPADTPPAPAEVAPEVPAPTEPPAPEPNPAPAEPTPAPVPPTAPDWEHKYKTLQGVLSAEQGRWGAEKKVLEQRLAALESQAKAPPPVPTAAPQPLVTDKDVETYGPELLDLIKRQATAMAQQIVADQLSALKPELQKTQDQVTHVATQVYRSAQEEFYGELAKAVPDYQAVNEDPRWLNWLGETDPMSGVARQVYLDNAAGQLDHKRVTHLFNAFKSAAGIAAPSAAPVPAKPTPSPSPRSVGHASAPTPREPETGVRRTEIQAHYGRSARDPSYRVSPEHQAMEARIATAMAAGKIVEA